MWWCSWMTAKCITVVAMLQADSVEDVTNEAIRWGLVPVGQKSRQVIGLGNWSRSVWGMVCKLRQHNKKWTGEFWVQKYECSSEVPTLCMHALKKTSKHENNWRKTKLLLRMYVLYTFINNLIFCLSHKMVYSFLALMLNHRQEVEFSWHAIILVYPKTVCVQFRTLKVQSLKIKW